MTIFTLAVIFIPSVVLLFYGEALTDAAAVVLSLLGIFVTALYLFVWMTEGNTDHLMRCTLPLVITICVTLVTAIGLCCLLDAASFLVFFLVGSTGGAFFMYFIRSVIVAIDPGLVYNDFFDAYWLALVGFSILCGVTAAHWKRSFMLGVSCFVGAYGLALSVNGIVPTIGGPYLPPYVFFLLFVAAGIAGLIAQLYRIRARRAAEEAEDDPMNLHLQKYHAARGEVHIEKYEAQLGRYDRTEQGRESKSRAARVSKEDEQPDDEEKRKERLDRRERKDAEKERLARERIMRMQQSTYE
jgi:hypothetical protein